MNQPRFRSTSLFLVLLVLVVPTSGASETARAAGRERLIEGLPEFGPLMRKYGDGWHAPVSATDTFVWIDARGDRDENFLLLQRVDEGTLLSQIGMNAVDGRLEGEHRTRTESGTERVLKLSFDRGTRTLRYAWSTRESAVVSRGDSFPDLPLVALDETPLDPATMRGKWVVLNWWATYCLPCREEIPELNRLTESHGRADTVFLAVAPDDPATIRRFLAKFPFAYRQSRGGEELLEILGDEFPRHLVIAPDGRIVADVVGGSTDIGTTLAREIDRVRTARR